MGLIIIDYDMLILVMVFAFAAVGLFRGAIMEVITTVLLALLSILLLEPELLTPILEKLNDLLKLIMALINSGFSFKPEPLLAAYKEVKDIIDVENPYSFLMLLTVVLLVTQYAATPAKLTSKLSPINRILGAILGAVNANIVLSLGKELILRYTRVWMERATTQVAATVQAQVKSASALAPNGMTLAVKDMHPGVLPESYWLWISGAILASFIIMLASRIRIKPMFKTGGGNKE